jgi:hypothetical protein
LHRAEQPLHQPGLLHHDAHENEQRHGCQRLLLNGAGEFLGHQEKHQIAATPVAENHAEKDQRERDRITEEDREQHGRDHDQADGLFRHGGEELDHGQRPFWIA